MSEQRTYRRIPFHTEAEVSIDETRHRCVLVDLALQGALFRSEQDLPLGIGQRCQITIVLPSSDLTMEFTGELIHQRGQFFGFIFVSEDVITMGHLRRLLELNFGNGDEVDQEFLHWLKQS
ncbi:MAG: PilZ domain-containing protein [Deltaproteobacteria bacterium]|nr:PilZ domain-containing protein [Deltaproteobacteria bacterium]